MVARPYAQTSHSGAMAYYWLTRVTWTGEAIVDRGEGGAAKRRIERWLRQVRAGSSPDWMLAARALAGGWEIRR